MSNSDSVTIPDSVNTADGLIKCVADHYNYNSEHGTPLDGFGYKGQAVFGGLNFLIGDMEKGEFVPDMKVLAVDLMGVRPERPDSNTISNALSGENNTAFFSFGFPKNPNNNFVMTYDKYEEISVSVPLTEPIPLANLPKALSNSFPVVESAFKALDIDLPKKGTNKVLDKAASGLEKVLDMTSLNKYNYFHNIRMSGTNDPGRATYNAGIIQMLTEPKLFRGGEEGDKNNNKKNERKMNEKIGEIKDAYKGVILKRELSALENIFSAGKTIKKGVEAARAVLSKNPVGAIANKVLVEAGIDVAKNISKDARVAIKESLKKEVSAAVDKMFKGKTVYAQLAGGVAYRVELANLNANQLEIAKEMSGAVASPGADAYLHVLGDGAEYAYEAEKQGLKKMGVAAGKYIEKVTDNPTSKENKDGFMIAKMCHDIVAGEGEIKTVSEMNAVEEETQKCLEDATRLHKDNPNLAIESTVNAVVNGKKEPENDSVTDEKMAADIAVLNEDAMPYTAVGDTHDNAGVENTIDVEQVNDR